MLLFNSDSTPDRLPGHDAVNTHLALYGFAPTKPSTGLARVEYVYDLLFGENRKGQNRVCIPKCALVWALSALCGLAASPQKVPARYAVFIGYW